VPSILHAAESDGGAGGNVGVGTEAALTILLKAF
jgi:hypothetical protein